MIKIIPLSEVCEQIVDCPHESPIWRRDGVPVIRNFNLVNGQIDLSDKYCVDEETYIKRTRRIIPIENDIIFSREAPIGNCAIIPHNFKCCLGQRLVLLRVNKKVCSPQYLLMVLLSDYIKKQIEQIAKTGSIVSNFNIRDLNSLMIPIIDEQEKMTIFCNWLNTKININTQINNNLEELMKTLYQRWFIEFNFPNEEGKPYKASGGEMIYNETLKHDIPADWNVRPLLNVVRWKGTSQPPKSTFIYEKKVGYIRFIQNRDYDSDTHKTYIPLKKALGICDEYDILMDKYGDAGKTRFGLAGAYNVALSKITVLGPNMQEYVRSFLSSEHIYSFLHNSCMASTRASLNEATLSPISIVIPNNDLLIKYEDLIKPMIKAILENKVENNSLIELREFLLPMLMNGQINVDDIKI